MEFSPGFQKILKILVACCLLLATFWFANSYLRYSFMAEGNNLWRVDRWTGQVWTANASHAEWHPVHPYPYAVAAERGPDGTRFPKRIDGSPSAPVGGEESFADFLEKWEKQNPEP